jgi:hypothetical protein
MKKAAVVGNYDRSPWSGRGETLCKSRGSPPDWNKNHDERCDGNVVNAAPVGVLYITGYEVLSIK